MCRTSGRPILLTAAPEGGCWHHPRPQQPDRTEGIALASGVGGRGLHLHPGVAVRMLSITANSKWERSVVTLLTQGHQD